MLPLTTCMTTLQGGCYSNILSEEAEPGEVIRPHRVNTKAVF